VAGSGKIYVAVVTGSVGLKDGTSVILQEGVTRVREGHPLLEGRESLFQELTVHYDVEDTRRAPQDEPAPEAAPKAAPEPVKAETKPEPEVKAAPAAAAPRQRGPRKSGS